MDSSGIDSRKMLQNTAQEFLKKECPWTYVKQIDESDSGFSKDLWYKVAELGWLGMRFHESYGGIGCTIRDLGIIYEEMGRALVPGVFFSSSVLCGSIILSAGSPQQKQQLLPAIARGQTILTLALTELDYGWGPEYIHLSATQKGDHFVLNGTKRFVFDAQIADQIVCIARTKKNSDPAMGITLFLVDKGTPGLSCRGLSAFSGEKLNELSFDSVEVPASNMLGEKNNGWLALKKPLNESMIVLCAYMLGACQHVLDMTVRYAQTRVQFGQPIGAFQWVQGYIIDQANHLQKARAFTYNALQKSDAGKSHDELDEAASLAKATVSEAFHDCCHLSHEVHAGIGVDKQYPLYLYSKKSKTLYSYLGDPYYHRKRIAKLLGL